MSFQQAAIKVQQEQEFGQLKAAVTRIFAADRVELSLRKLNSKGLRIRDFELVLAAGVFERLDGSLGSPGSAQKLYNALVVSDQAQLREFYLSKIEEIDAGLRSKYQKLFRYY